MSAPLPSDEESRLARLRALAVLDTPTEPELDDIIALAAAVCDVPIALVSLVDADRQWFKARRGLVATETSRDIAFCAHAIHGSELFVVEDATLDARFSENPLVRGELGIRFYAGIPLRFEGEEGSAIGTLCVIDRKPRILTESQRDALSALCRQVVAHLGERRRGRLLEERTVQLQDILDNGSDLIQTVSPEGKFLFVNRAWFETLGFTPADLPQLTMFDVIAPEHHAAARKLVAKLVAGEETPPIDTVFIGKTGRRVHVEGVVDCHFVDGKAEHTRGIFRDVSEQRAAEVEKSLYAEITRALPLALRIYHLDDEDDDASLRLVFENPAAEGDAIAAGSVGRKIDEIVPQLRALGLPALYRSIALGGPARTVDGIGFRTREGQMKTWTIRAFPLPGRQVGVLIQNTTERVLLASRLETLVRGLQSAVVLVTEEGTLLASRLFYELLGLPRPSTLLTEFPEALRRIADACRDSEGCRVRAAKVLTAPSVRQTDELLFADGRVIERDYLPILVHDREHGHLWMYRDISERKELERMKDEFVSTVSHELRTPLTSVSGALKLLSSGVVGDVVSERLELVRIAEVNCDRLTRLIDDILELEKLDAGRLELHRTALDAHLLSSKLTDALQATAKLAEVSLLVEGKASEDVLADGHRITQVLANLVSNAIKFSPRGGSVRICLADRPGRVHFAVHDSGPGIPMDKRDRLFVRFQQLDATDGRPKGGTGLGLAIAKELVVQHGGDIGVESSPGAGSVFWFELPTVRAANGEVTR